MYRLNGVNLHTCRSGLYSEVVQLIGNCEYRSRRRTFASHTKVWFSTILVSAQLKRPQAPQHLYIYTINSSKSGVVAYLPTRGQLAMCASVAPGLRFNV